ncbi:hypothetical protein M427DRAFT_28486 [Gonapodya prolifera JEL478]|uniref:Uncharacterized protein n=1 Tax=Gonapodya prolifera (strain JEL478) TaxID=1344416 RepID=A0A139AU17_GONPJ|nr:hypothetical protein M427DRAFT_28486 [Gonapodya prolifera JEL478]|eukprot:KXS20189.1 hypothetical protein M427DRAFT_28486 [Gonapodya prolifera JEL478]
MSAAAETTATQAEVPPRTEEPAAASESDATSDPSHAPAPAAEPAVEQTTDGAVETGPEPSAPHKLEAAVEGSASSVAVTLSSAPEAAPPSVDPLPSLPSVPTADITAAAVASPSPIPDAVPPTSTSLPRPASAQPSDTDSLHADRLPRPSTSASTSATLGFLSTPTGWLPSGSSLGTLPRVPSAVSGTSAGLVRVASLADFKPSPHRMETEIAQLRAQLDRTESILRSTQDQHARDLASSNTTLTSLRTESATLKRHASSLESSLAELRSREADREREVQRLLEELRGTVARLGSEVVQAKQEAERQKARAEAGWGDGEKWKRVSEDLTSNLRSRESDLEDARSRLHKTESELTKIKEEGRTWAIEKRALEDHASRTTDSLSQHAHLLTDAHEQLQAALQDASALREGNRDLVRELEDARSQLARMKSESEATEEGRRNSRNLSNAKQEQIDRENEKLKAEVAKLTVETQGHSDVLRKEKAEHVLALRAVQLQLEGQAAQNQLLKRRVEEHAQDMERMSKELQDVHDRHRSALDSHSTSYAEQQSEAGRLRDRINELSIENQGLLARGDKLAEEMATLRRDLAAATESHRTEIAATKREARVAESRVAELERELASAEENARLSAERLSQTSTDHSRTVSESTEMAKTVARLTEVNNGLRGEIARLRSEFEEKVKIQTEDWTKARINLNLALETEQKEKKKLLEHVTTLQSQMKHLQENHEAAIGTHRSALESKEQSHLDAVREVSSLSKEKTTLEETVRALEVQVVQAGDSARVAQEKATKTLETNRQHVKRLEEDLARTQKELAQSQKEVAEVRGQMKEHLRQHEMGSRELSKQLHEANQAITHWREQTRAHEQFIEKVKTDITELDSYSCNIQAYKPKSAAGNGAAAAESTKLRKELDEVSKERDRLAKELTGLQEQLNTARSERNTFEEQVLQLNKAESGSQSGAKSGKGLFFFRGRTASPSRPK